MKALLILLLIPLAFAQYASAPPFSDVLAYNDALAPSLDNYYNPATAQNSSLMLAFGAYSQRIDVSANVDIAGLSLSIDNMSCDSENLSVIFARGYRLGHLTSLPSEGYPDFSCDYSFFQHISDETSWRCDFDSDSCAEFENQTLVLYDMNVTFAFRNSTVVLPFYSNRIPVPNDLKEELAGASGGENLTISLAGDIDFIYEINDRSFGIGDCGSSYRNASTSIPFSVNRTFRIGGSDKLLILRSPILREQWFRNNRFDMLALSQCPLDSAEISINGNSTKNLTIRTYNVTANAYGLREIVSTLHNGTGWSEKTGQMPAPTAFQHGNSSFFFAYEFNTTYPGLGLNNLSIVVRDSMLNSAQFNDSFISRELSYDGFNTEDGSNIYLVPSRPSAAFNLDTLAHIQIGLGLIAMVLLLAFVNYWLLR